MALYSAITRLRRGELLGGDEGQQLRRSATQWMKSQNIRNPARLRRNAGAGKVVFVMKERFKDIRFPRPCDLSSHLLEVKAAGESSSIEMIVESRRTEAGVPVERGPYTHCRLLHASAIRPQAGSQMSTQAPEESLSFIFQLSSSIFCTLPVRIRTAE